MKYQALIATTFFFLFCGTGTIAQNGFLTFGNTANNTTASTSNTSFSGVRTGSGGGGWVISSTGTEIGTQAELTGTAPTSTSINSVGIASTDYGTAAQTFTISYDMYLTGGSSGTWYFFAGAGASFAATQSAGFTSNQVFTGLRFVFGASNTITTNFRNSSGTWTSTGISGTPLAQNTAYTISIVGNNSGSTVNYGSSQSVAANTFDFWVNGILVGDDLSKCQLGNTTNINAFRFYAENSTSNVAQISLDNIKWWNSCEAPSMSVYSTVSSIPSNTYTDLFVNNGSATLAGNVTVAKNLYYTMGTVSAGGNVLSYNAAATLNYTPASTGATTTDLLFPSSSGPTNLILSNGNGVTLHATRTISGTLTLNNGLLHTTSSSTLICSAISGGSAASYVDGPMTITTSGTVTVVVHVGSGSDYRTVSITPSSSSATNWAIRYFRSSPQTAYGSPVGSGINNISISEYFTIDRSGATPADATIALSWETNSDVADLADLRVVKWTGSEWTDLGNGGTTGSVSSGTISSAAAVTSFSPFTLGSAGGLNPLPVQLADFHCANSGGRNQLYWSVAEDRHTAGFEVQYSEDGVYWTPVASIVARPDAASYEFAHKPESLKSISYYRLKVDQADGDSYFSSVCQPSGHHTLNAPVNWTGRNPVQDRIKLSINTTGDMPVSYTITGMDGKLIAVDRVTVQRGQMEISVSQLSGGLYLLSIQTSEGKTVFRFVKE